MHLSRAPVPALQVGSPPFPGKAHRSAKPTHRDRSSLPTVRTRATRPRVLDALRGACTDARPCLSCAGLRFAPYVSRLQRSRVRNYFHMPCKDHPTRYAPVSRARACPAGGEPAISRKGASFCKANTSGPVLIADGEDACSTAARAGCVARHMHGRPPLPFLCRPAFCPVCVALATLSRSQLLPYAVRADALQCPFAQCPFAQREVLFRAVPFCTERGTLSHSALLHRKRYSSARCPFAQKEVLCSTVPFCTERGTLSHGAPFCTERGTLSYSALLHRQRYSFTVSKFPNRYYRLFTPSQPCRTHLFTRPSQYALVHKEVRLTHISSTIWS